MASDRAKWGNYVHSYISGIQGVNITLFVFSVVIVVYVVSVSVVFFLRGLCFVFVVAIVVVVLFCFFCSSSLCSFVVTIAVSVIHVRKYHLLEQHFSNLSIFFSPF